MKSIKNKSASSFGNLPSPLNNKTGIIYKIIESSVDFDTLTVTVKYCKFYQESDHTEHNKYHDDVNALQSTMLTKQQAIVALKETLASETVESERKRLQAEIRVLSDQVNTDYDAIKAIPRPDKNAVVRDQFSVKYETLTDMEAAISDLNALMLSVLNITNFIEI